MAIAMSPSTDTLFKVKSSYSVLKESIALNFALYFAKINILNESAFWSNLPVNFKVYNIIQNP